MNSRLNSTFRPVPPFVSTTSWSSQASAALREAARNQDQAAFCHEWRRHILARRPPSHKIPTGLCLWSLFDDTHPDPIWQLARQVFSTPQASGSRGTRSAIKSRQSMSATVTSLVTSLAARNESRSAVDALIAGEMLIAFDGSLAPSQTWQLLSRLAAASQQVAATSHAETPDQRLVRTGEVPWLAGLLLEPWREAKALRDLGRRAFGKDLIARTDSDGTPHAELLPRLALWLAPLLRATLWAEHFGDALWSDNDRRRLALLFERAIPLCRPDGKLALSNGLAIPALPMFEVAAKTFSLTGPAEKLLRTLKARPAVTLQKRNSGGVQTMPSNQSDWARFAVLRSDWSSHADCLAVSHHRPQPLLEITALGVPVIHGAWGWELQIGDARIEPADEWACSCWFSDPDADYLELQMSGPGALRIERQILLSRKEHFLLLADCVRGARSVSQPAEQQPIHLRMRLPLASGVVAEPMTATREIRLKAGKQPVRVFPLALADDRVQSTPHRCEIDQHAVVLHQLGQGNGLYAPLLFDWHPGRSRQPALWRTLTVAESGKVLGRDLAAGHRLQIGKDQLLIYRSLSPIKTARTVLGHHTWQESVIARWDAQGDVEPIVKVEP